MVHDDQHLRRAPLGLPLVRGFNEVLNLGADGRETADQVAPLAIDWLRRQGRRDHWFLHVHLWDPHTPYRTPLEYGNPFEDQPIPSWITPEVARRHWGLAGPHSAQEVLGFGPVERFRPLSPPAAAGGIGSRTSGVSSTATTSASATRTTTSGAFWRSWPNWGSMDDTAVMVSSDHGENLGELGIYCDHQTADLITHRVPLVLRWPGLASAGGGPGPALPDRRGRHGGRAARGDSPGQHGTGRASRPACGADPTAGRDHLVLSCAAWATQRSVRFDQWLCIRTYHDAFHGFPDVMLFDVDADPHEQCDLSRPAPRGGRPGLPAARSTGRRSRCAARRPASIRCGR